MTYLPWATGLATLNEPPLAALRRRWQLRFRGPWVEPPPPVRIDPLIVRHPSVRERLRHWGRRP